MHIPIQKFVLKCGQLSNHN